MSTDQETGPGPVVPPVEFHMVTYSPGPNWVAGKGLFEQPLEGHAEFQADLAARGLLLLSGPLLDRDGGISIIRAADRETAQALLADDPALVNGVFAADVAPLLIAFSVVPELAAAVAGGAGAAGE